MKSKIYIKNRKASFEYFILEKFEAGIKLLGDEVKSIRTGGAELVNSYIFIDKTLEVFTDGLKIRKLKTAVNSEFNPERPKKLLLKKKQIIRLYEKLKEKGLTIIPLALYFNERGLAKLEIGLAKGKVEHDKRKTIKAKDLKRQERREQAAEN